MARFPRTQAPDLIRHVTSRGNGRMKIFLDAVDYQQFVDELEDVSKRFAIRCWNYCLMPNHYHATLQPTLPNFSEALRRLNSVYAQWWNRRHGRVGHVFQGRFKAQIVDRDSYLLNVSRYVVVNPVRARLVSRAEEWPWSSYRATVGMAAPQLFLASASTLRLFGEGSDAALQASYVAFMTAAEDAAITDYIRSRARILGPPSFKELILASEKASRRLPENGQMIGTESELGHLRQSDLVV
jgi:REP element-mobilizing transposase RayT